MTKSEASRKLDTLTDQICRAIVSPLPHDPEVRAWAYPMRESWARELGRNVYRVARDAGRIRPDGTANLSAV